MANPVETELLRRLRKPDRRVVETNVFGRADRSDGARLIDAHFQLSRWCLWRWEKWAGRNASPGVLVPYPVENDHFARPPEEVIRAFRADRLGVPDDALVIGRIGQRMDGKWHPSLISAFATLTRHDHRVHLATIGMPEQCRGLLAQQDDEVRSRAIDIGFIDDDGLLAAAYAAMDVFVHAAVIGESFGYVLAESMLCETPVVAASRPHKDNSQIEVVGHGVGGLITRSTAGLAGATRTLLDDPDRRRDLGRRGRASVIERFDAEVVTRTALRVADHVVASNNPDTLRRRLADDNALVSRVGDGEVRALLEPLVGPGSIREKALMTAVVTPGLHRLRQKLLGRG
ncbi:MAG: glycosyltransferase [Planctomycetota bacterium]